jgi:hypothetical protein
MLATGLPSHRLPDWQPRLAALFAARAAMPFTWGQFDCCLFAADAVLAVTGHDPAQDLRGTYATAAEAAAVLRQAGGVVGVAISRAGPVVRPQLAQPGDVGLSLLDPAAPTLAVWGGTAWHAPGASGLVPVPPHAVVRAWRCTAALEIAHHA